MTRFKPNRPTNPLSILRNPELHCLTHQINGRKNLDKLANIGRDRRYTNPTAMRLERCPIQSRHRWRSLGREALPSDAYDGKQIGTIGAIHHQISAIKRIDVMSERPPHFILYSKTTPPHEEFSPLAGSAAQSGSAGMWHFTLKRQDGSSELTASAEEAGASGERLELLSVVRALEALDQPSRITLVTASGYVRRGLRFGLDAWREHGWQWERFGAMAPVKNRDLWQRVDQALRFHEVTCRPWRWDPPHDDLARTQHLPRPHFKATRPSRLAASRPGQQAPGQAAGGLGRRLVRRLVGMLSMKPARSSDTDWRKTGPHSRVSSVA